jgi:hypothetical protein
MCQADKKRRGCKQSGRDATHDLSGQSLSILL